MNIKNKSKLFVVLGLAAVAAFSFHLYAIDQSDCRNVKASESTMTAACNGGGAAMKNGELCEYDSTPGCPGCVDSQNGSSVLVYGGTGADDFHYVNCMDRHYRGYSSYGQCVGVVYTDSGFATSHVIYATVKCH